MTDEHDTYKREYLTVVGVFALLVTIWCAANMRNVRINSPADHHKHDGHDH